MLKIFNIKNILLIKKKYIQITFSLLSLIIGMLPFSSSAKDSLDLEKKAPALDKKSPSLQLFIIAGGFSKHLTTKYEPQKGYTDQHSNIGLEISQTGPGWVFSAQTTFFKDSHNEDSFLGVGGFGYRLLLPYQFLIYGGIGAGYVKTSYYNGIIALPYIELGWWRISVEGSYLPEFKNTDSGIALQFKFKIFEW